jgi:SMC interacting uncharacterized protein involved in chromosome segregation
MSEQNRLEKLSQIIGIMQEQLEQEMKQIGSELTQDIANYQRTIDELYEKIDKIRSTSHTRGKHEMKERVLKLLKNDGLFAQIDSYIPNFIEKKIYDQIIRALLPRINSIE